MTTSTQSKAQRRAESQRKAAERRAAELRAKRVRTDREVRRGPGGGPGGGPRYRAPRRQITEHAHRQIGRRRQDRADPVFPADGRGSPDDTRLRRHSDSDRAQAGHLSTAATGQTVDGVQCQTNEQLVSHVHTHLTVFVNGKARVIPYGIGVPGAEAMQTPHGAFVETGSCFYWLHTHQEDGVIHVESPSTALSFTLGQFFKIWGQPLSSTQVGPATGNLTVFFTAPGKKVGIYKGNPADLPLGDHYQIQIDVGTPVVKPVQITNWGDL